MRYRGTLGSRYDRPRAETPSHRFFQTVLLECNARPRLSCCASSVIRHAKLALTQFCNALFLSFCADQSSLKKIDFPETVHLTSDELEARDLTCSLTVGRTEQSDCCSNRPLRCMRSNSTLPRTRCKGATHDGRVLCPIERPDASRTSAPRTISHREDGRPFHLATLHSAANLHHKR